jgi:hypothetical protein
MIKNGDEVEFYGLNPRPYETVGVVVSTKKYPYIEVCWSHRDNTNFLHVSQVKVKSNA